MFCDILDTDLPCLLPPSPKSYLHSQGRRADSPKPTLSKSIHLEVPILLGRRLEVLSESPLMSQPYAQGCQQNIFILLAIPLDKSPHLLPEVFWPLNTVLQLPLW